MNPKRQGQQQYSLKVMSQIQAMLILILSSTILSNSYSFRGSIARKLCVTDSRRNQWDLHKIRSRGQKSNRTIVQLFRSDKTDDYAPAAAYIPLDGELTYDQPIICDPDFPYLSDDNKTIVKKDLMEEMLIIVPIISPIVAFFTFESFAKAYSTFNELLSRSNTWVAVDGGAYQARIIAPAINGLVVPAVALLFATLISTTINTLRQRQVEIRRSINMEAGELRAMECLVDAIDTGFVQDQCRAYLIQYTSRILSECDPRIGAGENVVNPRRGFDSELNGLTRQLNIAHGNVIPSHVADELYSSVTRLREQRVHRITALQSVYPPLHYVILVILAVAECIAYLIETDQELLVFLNAVQLKLLWSMLVGTFVACFAVVVDLRTPFAGSYQISASVDQLHTIKLTLQASNVLASQKKQQLENSTKSKVISHVETNVNGDSGLP